MATGIPDPDQTPDGPAYEGRLLVRPDDEVVDQGAGFDLRTLVSRRTLIGVVGLGVGATALAACTTAGAGTSSSSSDSSDASDASGSGTTTDAGGLPSGEIPDETAGPYPGDGSNGPDVLEESGIVRSDITTSIGSSTAVDGVPLSFTFTVTDMANSDAPFEGVAVYAWHCDAQGRYSMYSDGVEDETWLRGVQVADADGQVTFTSVMPGCYTGRWTHIHFEVYPSVDDISDAGNAIATSQMAFPEDVLDDVYALSAYDGSASNLSQITLDSDNIFGDDGGELQMATISGDTSSGYVASLTVRVDTATTPSSGSAPSGGGGGGTGGPGGGGPGAPSN